MEKQAIVESISPRHVGRLLEEAQIKPHASRYWCFTNKAPGKVGLVDH